MLTRNDIVFDGQRSTITLSVDSPDEQANAEALMWMLYKRIVDKWDNPVWRDLFIRIVFYPDVELVEVPEYLDCWLSADGVLHKNLTQLTPEGRRARNVDLARLLLGT